MNREVEPWRFFSIVMTRERHDLLNRTDLARIVIEHLEAVVDEHAVQMWGYVVLPDSVQFVVEVAQERDYHVMVEAFKAASEPELVAAIKASHDMLLDQITFYNPAWPQPQFLVWQAGYHTQLLGSPYAVSNKVADLVHKPVALGLANQPEDWPYSSYQRQHADD